MYHTPNLAGLRKDILPNRINEGWGLQHMKLYGIDDEIIMSGYVSSVQLLHLRKLTGQERICRATTLRIDRIGTISFPQARSPSTFTACTGPCAASAFS